MIVVAITGASGVVYGIRLAEELLACGRRTAVIATQTALALFKQEMYPDRCFHSVEELFTLRSIDLSSELFVEYANDDLFAPIASGSFRFDAIVVAPCSMKTLAQLAAGLADSLITRAFDVAIKERRKAIVVPRETPFSEIHLENMLRLSRAGAIILPPVPAFYFGPQTADDMINFVVGKIFNVLNIEHHLFRPWGSS